MTFLRHTAAAGLALVACWYGLLAVDIAAGGAPLHALWLAVSAAAAVAAAVRLGREGRR